MTKTKTWGISCFPTPKFRSVTLKCESTNSPANPETKPTFSQPWKYGDFGPAPQEIIDLTGIENYNIEITTIMGTPAPAVLNDEGNKIYMFGFTKQVDTLECLSDEEMKKILEDREPADAPSCPYFEPNPDAPRKIIWLSGMEYVW